MQALFIRLGGKIISGPAFQPRPSNAPGEALGAPPRTHLNEEPARSVPADDNDQSSSLNQQSSHVPQVDEASNTLNTLWPSAWLELCIRSSSNTYKLGEIGVAGGQADRTVFGKIREEYRRNRAKLGLFNEFAFRIPNGVLFVQVSIPFPIRL